MILVDAWKTVVVERFAKFDGRAGRPEFWWFALANLIIFAVLVILAQVSGIFVLLEGLYGLVVLLPSIGVGIRRLHDIDRSGWWYLIVFVPFVGGLILLVFFILEGTRGPNQFGPAPE